MSGQGTEASSTPGTCRTSQLSELLVGAVAMRLAGRKQASICLTSFSKHVPAGTPRSPHEASRSDTRSDNGSLHSGRSMQNIYPRTPHVAAADSSKRCGQIFPGGGMLCEKPLQKIGFRRALLLMKPAHTGHHPGAKSGTTGRSRGRLHVVI